MPSPYKYEGELKTPEAKELEEEQKDNPKSLLEWLFKLIEERREKGKPKLAEVTE